MLEQLEQKLEELKAQFEIVQKKLQEMEANRLNLRILRGTVYQQKDSKGNWSGFITVGTGWNIQRLGKGVYKITFNEAFSIEPTVVATQIYAANDANTRDNALIQGVTVSNFVIKVGDSDGDAQDRDFGFTVVAELK